MLVVQIIKAAELAIKLGIGLELGVRFARAMKKFVDAVDHNKPAGGKNRERKKAQ